MAVYFGDRSGVQLANRALFVYELQAHITVGLVPAELARALGIADLLASVFVPTEVFHQGVPNVEALLIDHAPEELGGLVGHVAWWLSRFDRPWNDDVSIFAVVDPQLGQGLLIT